jgi:hypothetical protein
VKKVADSISYPAAMLDDAKANGFGDPAVLPETFVIGRDGIVHAEFTPDAKPVTEKTLDQVVLPLLSKKAATNSSLERTGESKA